MVAQMSRRQTTEDVSRDGAECDAMEEDYLALLAKGYTVEQAQTIASGGKLPDCEHEWVTAPNTGGLIDTCTKCGEERA